MSGDTCGQAHDDAHTTFSKGVSSIAVQNEECIIEIIMLYCKIFCVINSEIHIKV